MRWFEQFASNTTAGSGNQLIFSAKEKRTGRVYYKITVGGTFAYSLLFSNILDSTYADGSLAHKNLICEPWHIEEAKVSRCAAMDWHGEETYDLPAPIAETVLTFGGKAQKTVAPGEFFTTDEVELTFEAGEFLCLEMTYSGDVLPYHEESLLPIFVKQDGVWTFDKHMPLPGMIGVKRNVKARVGFFGDSITQGIGTVQNSYEHWNAKVAQKLGGEYAFWNLGIGYGRANDAATDGAWMYKAKHNDAVVVCFGVNDILQGKKEEQIKSDLMEITRTLRKAGVKVLVQTVPPFDYEGEKIGIWQRVNQFIFDTVAKEADGIFDAAAVLAMSAEQPHRAKYGGHPDAQGCTVWADALAPVLKDLLENK